MELVNFIKDRKLKNRKSLLVDNLIFSNGSLISKNENDDETIDSNNSIYSKVILHKKEELQKTCQEHNCNICCNKSKNEKNFIILPCSHIFHIECLVETTINKTIIIDETLINTLSCTLCEKRIETEDLLYIHNKYYKIKKNNLNVYQDNINNLNIQMSKIKDELRTYYEYQQKIEIQCNKSKQIIVTINTLI